ncbi:MAG: hypothetical protein QXP60_08420 [Nitrososphaerota archaeon]
MNEKIKAILIVIGWSIIISNINFISIYKVYAEQTIDFIQIIIVFISSFLSGYLIANIKKALIIFVLTIILSAIIIYEIMVLPATLGLIAIQALLERYALSSISVRFFLFSPVMLIGVLLGGLFSSK